MSQTPLMPRATAIWLIDNTTLTFEQIAQFCGLHMIDIQSLADGDGVQGMRPVNPVSNGQLTAEEIKRCEANSNAKLQLRAINAPVVKKTQRGGRYTPIAKRRDKPNSVFFLLKEHPELSDLQICKLIGTTKNTIENIRNKTYWNYAQLTPVDPVFAGFCSQVSMNEVLDKASSRRVQPIEKSEAPLAPENLEQTVAAVFGEDTLTQVVDENAPLSSQDARALAEKMFGNASE